MSDIVDPNCLGTEITLALRLLGPKIGAHEVPSVGWKYVLKLYFL